MTGCLQWRHALRATVTLPVLTVIALAASLLGCGLGGARTLPPQSVADEVQATSGLPLARNKNLDVANMANVLATYHGSDHRQTVLVVVFNSPKAPVQIVGRPESRSEQEAAGEVIVERNVAVLYRSSSGSSRAEKIRRALAALAIRNDS